MLVNLTLALRQHVVSLHNVRRNNLALGVLPSYATARRMATIRWSPILASLAAYNVKQCAMKHDACHNIPKFPQSGQNLAIISYSGNAASRTNTDLITDAISLWWNEKQNANMAIINSYPSSWSGP